MEKHFVMIDIIKDAIEKRWQVVFEKNPPEENKNTYLCTISRGEKNYCGEGKSAEEAAINARDVLRNQINNKVKEMNNSLI